MSKWKRYSDGMVMLETAIAMVVFSICLGGMLSVLYHSRSTAQENVTQAHVSVVVQALQRFHREEGYVPCPNSPTDPNGQALERCHGAVEQIGVLPYKTLGVPEKYAKDGRGFYFTYAVSEHATFKRGSLQTTLTDQVLNIRGDDDIVFNAGKEGFAYLLISHGKRGAGAFVARKGRSRFSSFTAIDQENAQDTLSFVAGSSARVSEQALWFVQRADLTEQIVESSAAASNVNAEAEVNPEDPYASWGDE